jgi:hypothetical protein
MISKNTVRSESCCAPKATVHRCDCQYQSCRWSVLLFNCTRLLNSGWSAIQVKYDHGLHFQHLSYVDSDFPNAPYISAHNAALMVKQRLFGFENGTSVLARNALSSHQVFQRPSEFQSGDQRASICTSLAGLMMLHMLTALQELTEHRHNTITCYCGRSHSYIPTSFQCRGCEWVGAISLLPQCPHRHIKGRPSPFTLTFLLT